VIALNTFPYLAVPGYWILGRSRFQGYVKARQVNDRSTERYEKIVIDALAPHRVSESEVAPAGKAAERLAEMPFLEGNRVDLLIDGQATFDSIIHGIDASSDYILFQFFIVHDDKVGRRVKSHLVDKAKEGVRVYFLYDELGSHDLPSSYVEGLKAAGIAVSAFNARKGKGNRFQINFRNHRKVVVVDGRVAWIGGHNVGDEYLGRNPKFGHWRDTHKRILGPSVLEAQLSFLEDWHWATESALDLTWSPEKTNDAEQSVLIVPSGPADELETATLMFLHAINSAQNRIRIASPYFVPDDAIVDALQLAGLRGVDVRILIPDKPGVFQKSRYAHRLLIQ
jgi:cardiolipin synthase